MCLHLSILNCKQEKPSQANLGRKGKSLKRVLTGSESPGSWLSWVRLLRSGPWKIRMLVIYSVMPGDAHWELGKQDREGGKAQQRCGLKQRSPE